MPTALITGASSGIGEQFAYALAGRKYDLALTARREDRLVKVAERARQLGASRVEIVAIDLGERTAPQQIYDRLTALPLQIDYLVNNAGFGTSGLFHRLPLDREVAEIELNVTALVALTRLFLPAMVERRKGTIINVASTAAFQAISYMSTYAATKAFVLSFTEALAGELANSGVKVTALCPGPVRTEFQAVAHNEHGRVPEFAYVDAATVAEQGISAAESGRAVHIAGVFNFVGAQASRFLPRAVVNRITRGFYRPNAD
jgi:uncharacterized protein